MVWNIFYFSIIYGIILPNWLIFYKMVKTTNQKMLRYPSGKRLHSYWKWPSRNSGFTVIYPLKLVIFHWFKDKHTGLTAIFRWISMVSGFDFPTNPLIYAGEKGENLRERTAHCPDCRPSSSPSIVDISLYIIIYDNIYIYYYIYIIYIYM